MEHLSIFDSQALPNTQIMSEKLTTSVYTEYEVSSSGLIISVVMTLFFRDSDTSGEVRSERPDNAFGLDVAQPAQIRGRGEERRRQGCQGVEHGEDAQGAERDVEGHGVRTHQASEDWNHSVANQ